MGGGGGQRGENNQWLGICPIPGKKNLGPGGGPTHFPIFFFVEKNKKKNFCGGGNKKKNKYPVGGVVGVEKHIGAGELITRWGGGLFFFPWEWRVGVGVGGVGGENKGGGGGGGREKIQEKKKNKKTIAPYGWGWGGGPPQFFIFGAKFFTLGGGGGARGIKGRWRGDGGVFFLHVNQNRRGGPHPPGGGQPTRGVWVSTFFVRWDGGGGPGGGGRVGDFFCSSKKKPVGSPRGRKIC